MTRRAICGVLPRLNAAPARRRSTSDERPSEPDARGGRSSSAAIALAIAAVAASVYGGALRNGFVYDDVAQVVLNPWIRDPVALLDAFTKDAWAYIGTPSNYYRPMMHVLYAAAYSVVGLRPWPFHLVNILLHAASSVLVYATTLAVLARSPGASPARSRLVAAGSAVLFAVHPIHTEAVSWISAATDLVVAALALGSVYAYGTLPAERIPSRSPRYVVSVAAFFVATLAKEVAVVIPGLLVAYDLAFRPREASLRRRLLGYAPFAAAGVAYFLLRWNALGGFASVSRHADLTRLELGQNAFALLAGYVGKVLWPAGLTAFHGFEPIHGVAEPGALAGLAVVALLTAALALSWRRARAAFFALSCFLLPLLPSLYLTRLGENPFAERYLYLPSFGLTLLLACGAQALVARRPRAAPALVGAGALVAVAWGWAVVARQPAWHDDVALWRDASAKSPSTPIPHYNLGIALQGAGDVDGAIRAFETALRVQQSPVAWTSLGLAYDAAGRVDDAVAAFGRALQQDPANVSALNGLGTTYLELGQPAAALEPLRVASTLAPQFSPALHNLGSAYERLGKTGDAIESYRAALRANPGDEASYRRLRALGVAP